MVGLNDIKGSFPDLVVQWLWADVHTFAMLSLCSLSQPIPTHQNWYSCKSQCSGQFQGQRLMKVWQALRRAAHP